jgi:hypothetical protein
MKYDQEKSSIPGPALVVIIAAGKVLCYARNIRMGTIPAGSLIM